MGKYTFHDFIKAEISVHVNPDDLERFAQECDKYGARYTHDKPATEQVYHLKFINCNTFSIGTRTRNWIEFDGYAHVNPVVEFRDLTDVFPSMQYSFKDFLDGKINLRFRDAKEYADFQKKCDENKVCWYKWADDRIEKMSDHSWTGPWPKCYCASKNNDWYEVTICGNDPDAINLYDLTDWQLAKTDLWAQFVDGKIAIKCDSANQYDQLMQKCEQAGMRWLSGEEKPTAWKYGYTNRIWATQPQRVYRPGVLSNDRMETTVKFSDVFPEPDAWAEFVAGRCWMNLSKSEWPKCADELQKRGIVWCNHRGVLSVPPSLNRDGSYYIHVQSRTGMLECDSGSCWKGDKHPLIAFSSMQPKPAPTNDNPSRLQCNVSEQSEKEQPKYKVGDLFKCNENYHEFKPGDILEMVETPWGSSTLAAFKRMSDGVRHSMFVSRAEPYIAPAEQKIVITHDNKTTYAKLYEDGKVVKEATAKCSPDDKFDFNEGALLAFDRLLNGQDVKTLTATEMRGWASDLEKLSQTIFKAAQ